MNNSTIEHSHHSKGEPLSGRASELANSFLSELTEELSNPMGSGAKREYEGHDGSDRRSSRHRGEGGETRDRDRERERDRDRHRSSSSRHERSDRERSERDRHRSDRGERRERSREDRDRGDRERRGGERERGGDRGERERGGDRDRRDRDREYERYERDRRDRDRSRDRRSGRDDRYRDSRYGRRTSRSRSPPREMSPLLDEHNILPINKRVRKLKNWDVPPPGYEDKTVQQVKDLCIFPPPGQPAVLRSEILQGMDPERAAQLVHELPPRPLRMNFPIGGGPPGGMGNPYNNMNFGFRNNNGPTGANGVDHTLARQQRRLYCGNLPIGINEDALASFFNQTMMSMNFTTGAGAPVVSVHINREKNYAFVEFRTPEEATAAMAFDGIAYQSQTLKIRRPKDYQPPEGTTQEIPQIHVPGVISTNVPDSENKIFIGGLPLYLNDDQVIELLTAFGELKAFNLVKENNVGASKGFAFCEYLDPNITDIACQGLNNMVLGDKKLVVQRASVGSSRNQNPAGGANAIALHPNLMLPGTGSTEVVPTNVLQLLNMVTPEELEDDEEYQDIMEDIREECGKFGQIDGVKIPRFSEPGAGKIFVMFSNVDETTVALRALSGRKFADRTVLTSFFDVEKYLAGDF
ncbi:U2 small nuclear RNA auxiliary factor 2 [Entomortierella beljakovae]|nr:U2 small nuclear RNA auxiliary factor 2 [Entomortierella beljakovae]